MIHTVNNPSESGSAAASISLPHLLLRLEGLTIFISAIALYASQGYSGVAFALLLLVPDVSAVGYLVNPRVGALVYNLVHTYPLPALLIALGLALSAPVAVQVGLIWFAHIGMDRIAGYGLKYASVFKDTHLQRV